MPVQTTARPHDAAAAMPSFMSVYGQDPKSNKVVAGDAASRTAAAAPGQLLKRPATSSAVLCGSNANFATFHQHRGSTSTSASGSTDSSPTTTISTMDGSSLTEPSPGPSPASPAAKASPSSFSPDFRSRSAIDKNKPRSADGQFFELQRPTTPAKKPRNLKNLAVNTSGSLGLGRPATTANLPVVQNAPPSSSSAPSSPSFVKPPTPPRRRPSNLALTLQTGKNNALPTLEIPPTPSVKRPNTLRHFQSSPSLPLCSPCVAPTGGMQLPPPSRSKPPPRGFAEVPMEAEEEEQEPNFDVPQSREEKPAAYPNGPICIYESGVYLYFEPTAEQASNYDVVLNVASEVVNPFVKNADETAGNANLVSKEGLPPPRESKLLHLTDRAFAEADSVPHTASDAQPSSPTTPKATPISGITQVESHQKPEYIHIPWEHNTDIVPDLHRLVRLIDDRVQKGKRVLVHCQCGVSRSASLIVAYGLYKNPGISVQEAYDAVKKRSKWIGPNMNLIMQLQEFRNGLLRSSGHGQAFKHGITRRVSPNPAASRGKDPLGDEGSGSRTPATAPLPEEYDSPANPQRASTGNMVMVPPGPTSAPSSGWSPGFRRTWDASQAPLGSPIEQPFVDPMGFVIPVVTIQKESPETIREDPSRDGSKGRSNSQTTVRQVLHKPSLPLSKDQDDQANVTELASEKQGEQARLGSVSAPSLNRPTTSTSSLHERRQNKPKPLNEPFSPRTASFNFAPTSESDHGMVSPRNGNFALHDRAKGERPNDSVISMSDCCKGGNKSNTTAEPLASPRSEEFHMAPFLPSQESDDDFGLLSPTRFEFPKNPFEGIAAFAPTVGLSEDTGLRVHPILPAATETQPPAFSQFENFGFIGPESASRPRTPYHLVKNKYPPSEEPSPMAITITQKDAVASKELSADTDHLSAERPKLLRAKFSNPDLQTQFRLRALQGRLESQLPDHADQDIHGESDALSSPRAHEFTQNPFHVDLEAGIMSPPSVRASLYLPDRTALRKPVKVQSDSALKIRPLKMDPRSPAHAGVSPITRNIWDVL